MNRATLIHAVIAVIVALALVGAYVWWFSQVRSLAAQARSLSAQILAKDAEHAPGAAVRDLKAAVAEGEMLIASKAVSGEGIVQFLESLEAAGAAEGAEVGVVSVSEHENGRITISLAVSGSFASVMRTVGAIEQGPYAAATKSVTMDAVDEGIWNASYTLVVATP